MYVHTQPLRCLPLHPPLVHNTALRPANNGRPTERRGRTLMNAVAALSSLGLYMISPLPILYGPFSNQGLSGGNTLVRTSVGDERGEWGAQARGVFVKNSIDSIQRPRTKRISCKGQIRRAAELSGLAAALPSVYNTPLMARLLVEGSTLQGVTAASSGTHTHRWEEQASSLVPSGAPVCGTWRLPEGSRRDTNGVSVTQIASPQSVALLPPSRRRLWPANKDQIPARCPLFSSFGLTRGLALRFKLEKRGKRAGICSG